MCRCALFALSDVFLWAREVGGRGKLFPYYAGRLLPISKGMPNCRVKSGSRGLKVIPLPSLRARARAPTSLRCASFTFFRTFSILSPSPSHSLPPVISKLWRQWMLVITGAESANDSTSSSVRRRWSRRAPVVCRILRETAKAKAEIETITPGSPAVSLRILLPTAAHFRTACHVESIDDDRRLALCKTFGPLLVVSK